MYLVKILPNNINEIDNTLLMTNGPVETMKFLDTKGYLKLVNNKQIFKNFYETLH